MQVSFSTAVNYGHLKKTTSADHLAEAFDDYFYLGGRRAYVFPGIKDGKRLVDFETISFSHQFNYDFWLNVLKIISYATVILPFIMVVGKLISRTIRKYEVINREDLERKFQIIPQPASAMPQPLLGLMSEYIDDHAHLTPQSLEEMQGLLELLSRNEQEAWQFLKALAEKMGISPEQLASCETSTKLFDWIREEILHPLIAIAPKSVFTYISGLKERVRCLSRFEQAKNIDSWLRSKNMRDFTTALTLKGLGLRRLPPAIWGLTQMIILNLNDNNLQELSPQIGRLKDLDMLSVCRNQIKALPAELGQLTELHFLNVQHNQLQTLPEELCQLTKLRMLAITDNPLQQLPAAIRGESSGSRSITNIPDGPWA